MAAASPRDHRESRGFEPKPEVKSGSHSIQGARVDDAVSDVRNVLGSGAVDEVMIQKHAIEKLLNSALAKAIETVIGKPADKRFIGLSKVQSPFVAELKRKAIQFDKALPTTSADNQLLSDAVPSVYKIFQAAQDLDILPQNSEEIFYAVVATIMQPFQLVISANGDYLRKNPALLRRIVANFQYTTIMVAEMINGQSIALSRRSASAPTTPVSSAPQASDSSQSQPAEGVVSIPRNDIGTSVRSIAANVNARWPIKVVASTRAYYEEHQDKESQLTANTKLKKLIAVKINDVSAGYHDLQKAFVKVGGHLPATEMISPETVLTLAARIVRAVPVINANSDTVLDTQVAACVDKALDHFSKQIQANLPAAKFTELQRSIATFLVRLRVNYAHTLAIAVRAFILSNQKTDSRTGIARESLSVGTNALHQSKKPAADAIVGEGIATASGVPQQHYEQSKKTVASRGLVSDTRKSFRNTLLAAAMSAFSGIKDLSSSSAQPVNQEVSHSQPATTVAHTRQNPNPTPAPQPVPRQVQETAEVGQITGTVEIPVAGTIQGAINTALHQLNVDSGARTANEPRNALALWALRSHGVVLNNTQINLLINALTSRIADTEMHAGSHDSPKRAWHAGMPNSTRLRLTYTLGREPSFTITLLENNASRATRGSVTASFSVTPQMLIEGRAWEVATRTAPVSTLVTQNPYDPPNVPIF